jgi:site-specific DNA recombinase
MSGSNTLSINFDRVRVGDLTGLNVAALVRLSHEENPEGYKPIGQARSGAELNNREDQERQVREYVERRGGNYIGPYDEPDTSAWKRKKLVQPDGSVIWRVVRPVYRNALEDLKNGVYSPTGKRLDVIAVIDQDRLTRDQRDLEDAIDVVMHYGRPIIDIYGSLDLLTDNGRDMARNIVNFKARQSTDTAKRVRDSHYNRARAGIVTGFRAFGWDEDKINPHPTEHAIILKAIDDGVTGGSPHSICREWINLGFTTPRGKAWAKDKVKSVLLSPKLLGYRMYRGKVMLDEAGKPVRGQQKPLITDEYVEKWERLVELWTDPSRSGSHIHMGGRKYLLAGIARCICGKKMVGNYAKKTGKFSYNCPSVTNGGCGRNSVGGDQVDALITELILRYLSEREVQHEMEPWPRKQELVDTETQINELMTAYRAKQLSATVVFPQVNDLEAQAAKLRTHQKAWNKTQRQLTTTPTNVVEAWPSMTTEQRRFVFESLFHAIVVRPATKRGRKFEPERVELVWKEQAQSKPTLGQSTLEPSLALA